MTLLLSLKENANGLLSMSDFAILCFFFENMVALIGRKAAYNTIGSIEVVEICIGTFWGLEYRPL